ncbi:MAG: hypothetical protein H6806_05405 [Planctomycetes bacterium]|nr:hypothetical protein [Planctomycetota bacterium]
MTHAKPHGRDSGLVCLGRPTPIGGLDGERKADEEADSYRYLEADEAA